jgi:tetratricopeptide (TPR) repeat protein
MVLLQNRKLGRLASAVAGLLLLLLPPAAGAHPGIEIQLARLAALIEQEPTNVDYLLQRAELYRLHEDYDRALTDLAAAAKQKPDSPGLALARARVCSDLGRTQEALESIETVLTAERNHPEALLLRARCLSRLNRAGEAVVDYNAALRQIPKPAPDLFLERARTQAALGRFDDAVSGLDEGLTRLGDLVTLQLAGIEYERAQAKFDAALVRVDKVIAGSPVKETWLVLRGEVLEQAGRLTEARKVFQQTLARIAAYPPARHGRGMTLQLEQRARTGLARTEHRLALTSNQNQNHVP